MTSLDQRGILLSIVSKNNPEDALAVLRRFGIEDYFFYPQISWAAQKPGHSQSAASLNIGLDSLLFVDDSRFERAEVAGGLSRCDDRRCGGVPGIPQRPDARCRLPTRATKRRRLSIGNASSRVCAGAVFRRLLRFPRDCKSRWRLAIRRLEFSSLERHMN